MHLSDSGVRLSATDLAHFLSCRHLTALDLGVAQGRRGAPHGRKDDPLLDLIIQRGNEHEAAYVRSLAASGSRVVDLNVYRQQPAQALAETLAAIRDGAEVVVQAALKHESWFGYADILRRIPQGSTLGDWSYEVIDTKLARETRAGTILQLGLYSAMLATVQGTTPEHFHVVVPGADGTGHVEHSYRVDDFAAYFRLIQREMLDGVASGDEQLAAAHYPEPVEFCEICRWWRHCDHRRRTDDHLSLVANLGRIHRRELESHDYPTLTTLAGMPIPVPFRPKRGSRETYERAREQALVQLVSRDRTTPVHTLRPLEVPRAGGKPVEPRGLARLPAPSPGDVFLDLEGDPFADEGGREYLFGITTVDAPGKPDYHEWWAFTPQEERAAFESVMDFIMDRLARHPDMHVYHYAHYEPSAFKRVMGRYATREEELDRLLRGRRFIDLLAVVRQSMWVGVESYSIKRLEPLYDYTRDVNLPDASSALRRMEYALQLRNPALVTNEDRATIRGYNRDDCVSTLFLRDWLERVRAGAVSGGWQIDRPPIEPDEPTKKITERDVAVQDLRGRLLHDVPGDGNVLNGEARARWLLAYLLDYHRREDKATWWEYYRLREMPEEDLLDERKAIAAMEFVARIDAGGVTKAGKPKGRVVDRYRYPDQEMEIERGDSLRTPNDGKDFADVVAVDRLARTVDISKTRQKADMHPTAVFAFEYVKVDVIEDSIRRFGEQMAAAGSLEQLPRTAAGELLLRRPPHLGTGGFVRQGGETEVRFAIRAGLDLDHSLLAIQGPPGAGKTFTGAEMICALVKAGKRVGVTANSHKVIRKLLAEALHAARRKRIALTAGHKDGDESAGDGEPADGVRSFKDNATALTALQSGDVQVLGGTSWLWSRSDFAGVVDVLFVDEAGQMALANVVAVAQAANSVVLLGDPRQLDQPTQGSHPDGVATSALQHLLGEHQTMPAGQGIFLPKTWRMSPRLSAFTSELYYEGRLVSKDGLERQVLVNAGEFSGSGLWAVDVAHDGNRNHSTEEVAAIADLVRRLTSPGVEWCNEEGATRHVTVDDILIVAPYNSQVNRLIEHLPPGARIGTVDKFQGQEAPVVIYTMATSRPEDAPRGMEFLYSPNRLNVATSRARCAVILVASPHLYSPECRSVRQMTLANGLCRFRELAQPAAM